MDKCTGNITEILMQRRWPKGVCCSFVVFVGNWKELYVPQRAEDR